MDIIGVAHDSSTGIAFIKKDSVISTNLLYIVEFFNIFKNDGVCDIGFSYNLGSGRTIIPTWTPNKLGCTNAGIVMQKVDDYLKKILIEMAPIYCGELIMDQVKNKTILDPIKINTENTVTGIYIQPKNIKVKKSNDKFEVEDIEFELKYWRTNSQTGTNMSFSQYEIQYINQYQNEFIPNLCRCDPNHPYNHLKKIIVAQHIAKYLVQNTKLVLEKITIVEKPLISIPVSMTLRHTENVVIGYNHVLTNSVQSNNWHEFKYENGRTSYKLLENVNPTSEHTTTITSLSSSGGIKSESTDAKLIARGFTIGKDKSISHYFVGFTDDSEKCKMLKTRFNQAVANAESFTSDASTIGQLIIDTYRIRRDILEIPKQIEIYCNAH